MKLSIITINRNNKEGLRETIESVVSQTFADFEYIVIDGASTDGSVELIEEYADKITYWVSEPDKGIYNAMNKGILQAKGEYCLFLNSGDSFIEMTVLDRVFSFNLKSDIFCTKAFNKEIDDITFYDFYVESLKHQSMFIKTNLFQIIGMYDEGYKIISDWAFYVMAIIKYNCSLSFYDFELYKVQEGGISWTDGTGIRQEKERFMRDNFRFFLQDYENLQQYKKSRIFSLYNKLLNNSLMLKWYKLFIG